MIEYSSISNLNSNWNVENTNREKKRLKDTLIFQDIKKKKQEFIRTKLKVRRAKIIASRRLKKALFVSKNEGDHEEKFDINNTPIFRSKLVSPNSRTTILPGEWNTYVNNLDSPDPKIRRDTLKTLKIVLYSNISPTTLDYVLMNNEKLPYILLKHLQNQFDKPSQIEAAWCIVSLCCASHKSFMKLNYPPKFTMDNLSSSQSINDARLSFKKYHKRKFSWEECLNANTPLSKMFFIIPFLLQLVKYSNRSAESIFLAKQSLYAFCNIASDSRFTRMYLLKQGIIQILLENMYRNSPLVRESVKCLGNIVRVMKNQDEFVREGCLERVSMLLSAQIQSHIINRQSISNDTDFSSSIVKSLIPDLIWIMSYLTSGDSINELETYSVNIYQMIVTIMQNTNIFELHIPCIRIIGNLLRTRNYEIHRIIFQNQDILKFLYSIIRSNIMDKRIRDILFLLSNFCSGPEECVDAIIKLDFIDIILSVLQNELISLEIKKEAVFIIVNVCASGIYLKEIMFKLNGFVAFVKLMKDTLDVPDLFYLLLNFLRYIFEKSNQEIKLVRDNFVNLGGMMILRKGIQNSNSEISTMCSQLLDSIKNIS